MSHLKKEKCIQFLCSFTFSSLFIFSVEKLWYTFKLFCIFLYSCCASKQISPKRDLDPESLDLSAPRATARQVSSVMHTEKVQKQEISTWICSVVHWSRLTDFTLDMCTPRFLWMPAHRMQINTPRFQDAHLGPVNDS